MLVATLMVIAVSGYAAEQFVPILTTNFDDGNLGNWSSWGNNSTSEIVASDRDGGEMPSVDKPFRYRIS